ncbi:MAG: hypothetical protein K8W52_45735 [Deltaproteobacteria bacterium]|nr:hypothetical protein [Deltaproteobacteria bacterium]
MQRREAFRLTGSESPARDAGLPGHTYARHGAARIDDPIGGDDVDLDPDPIGVARPVRSARSGPRRHVVLALDACTPAEPIDVDGFQELRRLGLFDDCGRNPPPSWWAR